MGQQRSLRTFLATFFIIFMMGMSIEVFSQVINSLRATNVSQLVVDNNANGLADGGDVIQYTIEIANCSSSTISGAIYQSDLDPNTSLVPNSVQVTTSGTGLCGDTSTPVDPPTPPPPPVNADAIDDLFAVTNGGNVAQNVLTNDTGEAPLTVVSFGDSLANVGTTPADGVTVLSLLAGGGTIDITINATGAITITSVGTMGSGSVTLFYQISSPNGTIDNAQITINFGDFPVAMDDLTYTILAGNTLTVIVAGPNDLLLDNDLLGTPPATLTLFGGGDASGAATTPAGGTIPLGTGSLTVNTDGSFTFTPNTGFTGDFDFQYTLNNGIGTSTGNVTITVQIAPVAQDDANLIATVGTITNFPAPTLFNDNGSGADNLGVPAATIVNFGAGNITASTLVTDFAGGATTPAGTFAGGTLTVNADGSFSVNNPTAPGLFTFRYRIQNAVGFADAIVTIDIRQGPIAEDDAFTVLTGITLNGDLTADNGAGADFDGIPPYNVLTFGAGSLGGVVTSNNGGASVPLAGGTLTVNLDGTFSFVNPTTAGTYTFNYRLSNTIPAFDDATVTITVQIAPVAQNDTNLIAVVGSITNFPAPTLFNNNGSGADNLGVPTATIVNFGAGSLGGAVTDNVAGATTGAGTFAGGTLTVNADGSFSVNNPTLNGTFTFLYRIQNVAGFSDAIVTVTIQEIPIAQDDTFNTGYTQDVSGYTISGNLTANNGAGVDVLGLPPASITSLTGGIAGTAPVTQAFAGGSITVNADGTFTLTNADSGTYTFTYTLDNGIGTDTALVTFVVDETITVSATTPVNSAINVPLTSDVVITFDEAPTLNGSWFTIMCGATNITTANSAVGLVGNMATINPTPVLPTNELCTVTVLSSATNGVTDADANDAPDLLDGNNDGLTGDNFVFSFTTVDDAPPSVTSAEAEVGGLFTALPLGVGQFADTDTDLRITFSEAVTVAGNWAELDCTATGVQDVTFGLAVTDADPVFMLNPATNLTPGESCTLTIFAIQVADEDAPIQNMVTDAVFTFIVADVPPQVLPPTVPINGATVPNNQAVTINFTENVNITAGGITWTCNAVAVPFTPALPASNVNTITLTPTGALTNGQTCTVTLISTLITDFDVTDPPNELDGNFSNDLVDGDADNFVLTFTVDAQPSLTGVQAELSNVLTAISPPTILADVDNDTSIVLTFSEAVNNLAGVTVTCTTGAPLTTNGGGLNTAGNGSATLTITRTAGTYAGNDTCAISFTPAQITDVDAFDPPDTLVPPVPAIYEFTVRATANDDAYTITPHLTFTSPLSVRDNDDPANTTAITGFGATLGTANGTVANGTTVGVSSFITIAGGGRVYMNPDGTFVFYPDAGVSTGTASFFYTITGGDTAQVNLNFDGQELVWFVNLATPTLCIIPNNIGTQACPDSDVTIIETQDSANDTIYFAQAGADYFCEPLTLEIGGRVVGDGSTSTLATVSGVTPALGSSFPTFTGTHPVLNNAPGDCITLSSNNDLYGFTIGNTDTFVGVAGTNFGLLTVADMTINGTGQTVLLDNGTLDITFDSLAVTSCDGSSSGIQIANVTAGTFDVLGGVNISNCNVNAISFNNNVMTANLGDVTLTNGLFGLISANGGTIIADTTTISGVIDSGIAIINHPATKPVTFGATSVTKSASGAAISFSGSGINQAAAITFASLDVTNNASDAIRITNQTGTVTVTSATSSNITAFGGVALIIENLLGGTTPLAMNFTNINASSGSGGIILNNTSGTLSATGGTLNTAGNVVGVFNSTVNLTYGGSVTSNSGGGYAVNINMLTSPGAVTLNGTTIATNISQGVSIQSSARPVSFGTMRLGTTVARFTSTPITLATNTGAVNLGDVDIYTNNANGLVIDYFNTSPGTVSSTAGIISATGSAIGLFVNHSTSQTINLTLTEIRAVGAGTHAITLNRAGGTLNVTGLVEAGAKTAAGVAITNANVLNTSIDELDVTGANVGVLLNNNIAGSFTILGDGNTALNTNGAGGTMTNLTTNAFNLNDTSNLNINDLIITNTGSHGFVGSGVVNMILDNVDMTTIGNADNEYGLNFTDISGSQLSGNVVLDNVNMNIVADHMVYIENFAGALNLTITNSTFEDTISTTACSGGNCNGDGLLLRADGTSSMNVTIQDNIFNRLDGIAINANPEGATGAVMEIDIINNAITANPYGGASNTNNGEIAISLRNAQGNSVMRFDVNANTISNYSGELALGVIEVEAGDFTLSNGAIRNNTINHAYDGNVITLFVDGANTSGGGTTGAVLNVSVTNNTVPASLTNIFGVSLLANNNGAILGSSSVLNLIATNNMFNANAAGTARRTLTVNVRDFNNACMDIRSNTLAAGTGGTQPSINVSYNGSGTVRLQGMIGLGDANAQTYLNANNTLTVGAISGFNNNITAVVCTTPSYP